MRDVDLALKRSLRTNKRKLAYANDIEGAQASSSPFMQKNNVLDRVSNPVDPIYQYPGARELKSFIDEGVKNGNKVELRYGREFHPNRGSYIGRGSSLQEF